MVPKPRFLTAEWRDLVMLSYEIDPAVLTSRVPRGCELDAWEGRHFVSVVGFRFLRTRVHSRPARCGTPSTSTWTRTSVSIAPSLCFLPGRTESISVCLISGYA